MNSPVNRRVAPIFKPGDQIELKSGGPIMTVESIGDKEKVGDSLVVWCVWFNKLECDGWEGCRSAFSPFVLNLVEPEMD